MKISCVIVSVGYADYLAHTLPHNKSQFDETVVVSDTKDEDTDKVCEFFHVRCIKTDKFYEGGAPFNKAKGINEGIRALQSPEFVVHQDGDIVLPPRAREILERRGLDEDSLYGCDRYLVPTYEAWQEFLAKPRLQHANDTFLFTDSFPIGTRIVKFDEGGYIPIGFFQLFHAKHAVYPENHSDAGQTDMLFAKSFPPNKRTMLGDFFVYHLATEDQGFGTNWQGRKSMPFGPRHESLMRLTPLEG